MPFIHVNGTDLYYEIFGADQPSQAPVVLIHGATLTGEADWGLVAPLLARHRRVIVPDCRGHGRSANPRRSYAFREMADDTAALICSLGYERAHLIGHSNGGNVALVTLLEHPEVVQSAVLQAANAYVSPDLVDREPVVFDPERVAREDPGWMSEMIALHGPTHGPDYWRDLLRLTLEEIIRAPNYTADDLARVQKPALVIQGQNDPVNAPARHAQFIARHLPYAECWIPSGIGHNVHVENLFQWVERVEDFLARRGDEANEALYRLKRDRYSDERETVFEVRAQPSSSSILPSQEGKQGGVVDISGRVLTEEQALAAKVRVAALGGPWSAVNVDIRVLLTESTPTALVTRGVTDLRREPSNRAERVSQALLGEGVQILEEQGEWARIRLEKDGYLAWIHTAALHRCNREEIIAYRENCSHLVKADLADVYHRPVISGGNGAGDEAGKLPFGAAVRAVERRREAVGISLPGDCLVWISDADLAPLAERPRPDAQGIAQALALFRRFVGVPYLWGGRTPFGFDCSGLAQAFWGYLGVHLPRDADQQFRAGSPVDNPPQPGDLLFFGESGEAGLHPCAGGRGITHVAISLGGWEILHANGATWSVAYNSLDPAHPRYRPWLRDHLQGIRRFW